MGEVIEAYQTEIDAGVEGAKDVLAAFIADKQAEIAEIVKHGDVCREWARDSTSLKRHMDQHLKEERRKAYVVPPPLAGDISKLTTTHRQYYGQAGADGV